MKASTALCITGMLITPSNVDAGSSTRSRRAVPCAVYAGAFRFSFSLMALSLLPDDDDAALRTGNRAADIDQIAFEIDLLHPETDLRVTLGAEMARHLLALDDARWIGAGSDRSRTTMLRVAVRIRTAGKVPALHDALKPAS